MSDDGIDPRPRPRAGPHGFSTRTDALAAARAVGVRAIPALGAV